MKTILSLTSDQIFSTQAFLENIFNLHSTVNPSQRVTRSIAFDLEDIFTKKRKSLIKKNNLFEASKKHKVTLKYHELHALQAIIYDLISKVENRKTHHDLQQVHDMAHKILA